MSLEAATPPAEPTAADPVVPRVGRPPLFVLFAALLLFFVRFGYDYGTSDQDEIIPYVYHRMDPSVLTQDWFVQTQVADFSVRTYFVWVVHFFSLFLPVWLAVLLLHIATWLLVAGAVYALARLITEDRIAASATVVLALVLTPFWTLGGNELVHSMLVPSTLAWGLALWALYHFLRARYVLTPVLLGVACWMQALVGLQVAGLLIVVRFINIIRREHGPFTFGSFAMFTALFVLWSSPALGPLLYQQFAASAPEAGAGPSMFYILAQFRVPHHYLFHSFQLHSVVRFVLLAIVGVALLTRPQVRAAFRDTRFIVRVLAIIGVLCVISYIFTELIPVLFITKLQLFKLTVLAKLLLLIVIAGAAARWLPGAVRRPFEVMLDRSAWSLGAVLIAGGVLVFAVLNSAPGGFLHDRIGPWVRQESDYGRVEAWVRHNTSYDAVFAVPPSNGSFRTATARTIIANYKAIPYEDDQLRTWFKRLTDLAPLELPERGSPELPEHLDQAYESLTATDLARLRSAYTFQYVLRSTPLRDAGSLFREVFQSGDWHVYEVTPKAPPEATETPAGEVPEAGA